MYLIFCFLFSFRVLDLQFEVISGFNDIQTRTQRLLRFNSSIVMGKHKKILVKGKD